MRNLTLQFFPTQRNLERRIKQYEAMRVECEAVEIAEKNLAMNSVMGNKNDTSAGRQTNATLVPTVAHALQPFNLA